MSAKKVKALRAKFEKQYGFTNENRDGGMYKSLWRKYKKEQTK